MTAVVCLDVATNNEEDEESLVNVGANADVDLVLSDGYSVGGGGYSNTASHPFYGAHNAHIPTRKVQSWKITQDI